MRKIIKGGLNWIKKMFTAPVVSRELNDILKGIETASSGPNPPLPECQCECQAIWPKKVGGECGEPSGHYGWYCTRVVGHTGKHVACGSFVHDAHVWPQKD